MLCPIERIPGCCVVQYRLQNSSQQWNSFVGLLWSLKAGSHHSKGAAFFTVAAITARRMENGGIQWRGASRSFIAETSETTRRARKDRSQNAKCLFLGPGSCAVPYLPSEDGGRTTAQGGRLDQLVASADAINVYFLLMIPSCLLFLRNNYYAWPLCACISSG